MTLHMSCMFWGRRVVMNVSVNVDWMWVVEFVHVLQCLALHLLLLSLLPVLFLLEVLLLFDLPFPLLLLQLVGSVVELVLIVSEAHMIIVLMVWNDLGSLRLMIRRYIMNLHGLWSYVRYRT